MEKEDPLQQRAATIRARLYADMHKTLVNQMGYYPPQPEGLLSALVDDAMHQVELLLTEQPRKEAP